MEGYCLKCRTKAEMVNGKVVKTGERARMMGECKKCGCKISVFLKKDDPAIAKKKK